MNFAGGDAAVVRPGRLPAPAALVARAQGTALERRLRARRVGVGAARPDVLLVRDHFLTASCVPVARRLGLPLVIEAHRAGGRVAPISTSTRTCRAWPSACSAEAAPRLRGDGVPTPPAATRWSPAPRPGGGDGVPGPGPT
ncbi:MAG: hypothetical protein U0802_22715 [Candidatus Binatia bacterium]